MFVCVARVSLDIPASGSSLKAKRQVVRRVTDRVKARFNVSVAEVDDNDLWARAVIALAVVSNEQQHVNEQMDKIIHFIEEMYVAPVAEREIEILQFGEHLFSGKHSLGEVVDLRIATGERSLAEAEGMGEWEDRHQAVASSVRPTAPTPLRQKRALSLDQAKAKARALRNKRDWER